MHSHANYCAASTPYPLENFNGWFEKTETEVTSVADF